jgi:putative polyhydroxyalkanoate system protein
MATISISKKHHLGHKAALEAAENVAADLQQRFGLRCEWDGDRCLFERAGLAGELVVGESEVRLDCRLGLLLGAIKPAIESAVHREFDQWFATPAKERKPASAAHPAKAAKSAKRRKGR